MIKSALFLGTYIGGVTFTGSLIAHRACIGCQQASIDSMPSWQHQWVGVQVAIELAIGNQGASEGAAADVSSEEEGRLDHGGGRVGGKTGVVVQVGGKAGQHSSHANQRVEGSNKLRQVSDLNLLGNGGAKDATASSDNCHLGENLRVGLE